MRGKIIVSIENTQIILVRRGHARYVCVEKHHLRRLHTFIVTIFFRFNYVVYVLHSRRTEQRELCPRQTRCRKIEPFTSEFLV